MDIKLHFLIAANDFTAFRKKLAKEFFLAVFDGMWTSEEIDQISMKRNGDFFEGCSIQLSSDDGLQFFTTLEFDSENRIESFKADIYEWMDEDECWELSQDDWRMRNLDKSSTWYDDNAQKFITKYNEECPANTNY